MGRNAHGTRRGRPRRRQEDAGPTPETLAKLESDVLTDLMNAGSLSADQSRAARQLHVLWGALSRGFLPMNKIRAAPPGPGRKQPRDAFDRLSEGEEDLWRRRYRPWADREAKVAICRRPFLSRLELVRRMVHENQTPDGLACAFQTSAHSLVDHLAHSLDSYIAQKKEK